MRMVLMSRARLGWFLSVAGCVMIMAGVMLSGDWAEILAGNPATAVSAKVAPASKPPVYAVALPEGDNRLSLTFNAADGGEAEIPELLALLKEHDARATFFLTGTWAKKHPALTKQIADSGCEVASHGMRHRDMPKSSLDDLRDEIEAANTVFSDILGAPPALFRAPSGAWNDRTCREARARGMQIVQWNADSLDWKNGGRDAIVSRISPGLRPGAIALFHANAKDIVPATRDLLALIDRAGLTCVPVSELILPSPYRIDARGVQHDAT